MYVGACRAIRLYLGASLCTSFFWLLMYYCWTIHDRGRYFEILCYLCFLFHCLLIYIDELFMIYVFIVCFVK